MKKEYNLLIAGTIGVIAATGLSFIFLDHWVGLFPAVAIGIIFLVMLYRWMSANVESEGIKKTVRYLLAFIVVLHAYSFVLDWFKTERQQKIMTEVRRTIDGSAAQIESEQILIKTLRHYYLKSDGDNVTLESSFMEVAEDRLHENGKIEPSEPKIAEELNFKAEFPREDSIIVRVNSNIARGEDENFVNFNGQTGKYQAAAILTPKGVSYVREN